METLVLAVPVFLLGSTLVQLALVLAYTSAHRRPTGKAIDDASLPVASVLMAVRGADASLSAAIRSVLDQDYPKFQVHIILDSEQDPGREIVEAVLRSASDPRVKLDVLRDRPADRSLMCSCAVQFLEDLDPCCGLIAFCAADMIVPRSWLREMGTTLSNPEIGGTLGNRWYLPPRARPGSLVRYLWNAGAEVLMRLCRIPWSGALGLRPGDVRQTGLEDRWRHGMIEDVPAYSALRRAGLRLEHRPGLTVVDHDECGLAASYAFIKRQLLWARLYHPGWRALIPHAGLGTLSLIGPLLLGIWCLWSGRTEAAGLIGLSLVAYIGALGALVALIERAILEHVHTAPGDRTGFWAWWPGVLAAIPLCQLLYGAAAVACLFTRSITWRGITYRIDGPFEVTMLGYRPLPRSARTP